MKKEPADGLGGVHIGKLYDINVLLRAEDSRKRQIYMLTMARFNKANV